MNTSSIIINSRKTVLSIVSGVLCFILSPYGIQMTWETITISLPWSILFPVLISMVYGWKYGLISGLSGGALFPFYLWKNNGYADITTSVIYLLFYFLLGMTNNQRLVKKIKSHYIRIFIVTAISVIVFKIYYKFIFNYLLSLNPPFWINNAIKFLPHEILNGFFIKDSINFIAFVFISTTLIKIPLLRNILELKVTAEMKNNGKIFLYSILISLMVWFSYFLLGKSLLHGENALKHEPLLLALLVIITSNLMVARVIIYFSETQIKKSLELIESEKKYKSLSENSKDYIMRFDRNHKYLYLNQISCGFLQISSAQIIDKTLRESGLFSNEQCSFLENSIDKVFETGEIFQAQFDFFNGNETICFDWMFIPEKNEEEIVENVLSISRDVTKQKEYEKELLAAKEKAEASEQTFRRLFEDSADAILLIDISGTFVECNQAALNLLKMPREQFLYMTPVKISPEYQPDGRKSEEAAIEMIELAYKNGLNRFDWTCINALGEEFIVEVSLMPIVVKGQIMLHTTWRDITIRKQNEAELHKQKEKAEESDRLKTAFLQNISHEIRTPLNAICGFTQMLNKPNFSEEKKKSFASIILNSSSQLLSIVTDILTVSSLETKQEKLNIKKVNINSIIVELLAIFKAQSANQNISLFARQQLNDQQAEIYTDKTKITQILSNLISNALKFTHVGTVEFGYQLKVKNGHSELEFYVKDTGIGIKTDQFEKIFERFRQADLSITKNYGGTGLGLAICKGFVELLGGKIWVKSELEKGFDFYFTIPYNPVHEISEIISADKENRKQISVLVAEDDESNYLYIEELLLDFNIKILHAKNGNEAVELWKSNVEIDLILMDIKMPLMDGHEAAKIIKQHKPDLPIIAQSAYALEHERSKYEGTFDDYLTKPIEEEMLKNILMKYIEI